MPIERDTVLIVDVESTCWKKHKNPPGEQSEIIEIGICTYHIETGEIKDKKSIFIKPTESTVSPFCTKLTTITPEMLDEQVVVLFDEERVALKVLFPEVVLENAQDGTIQLYRPNDSSKDLMLPIRFEGGSTHVIPMDPSDKAWIN